MPGIERQENAYLTAANANLGTIWDKLTDKLKGTTVRGNNLVLNIHVGAQKIAETALRGKCGAAVVLNPKTGAVYVMASSPGYDPNRIESPNGFAGIIHSPSACPGSSSALLNRATQGVYPPGSTFKTVTAAAALDSGKSTRRTRSSSTPATASSTASRCRTPATRKRRSSSATSTSCRRSSTRSTPSSATSARSSARAPCSTRRRTSASTRSRRSSCPRTRSRAAGSTTSRRASSSTTPGKADPGRLAFGQDKMLVTPLQMALVAAGVANNGTIMQPHLVKKVTAPGGGTVVKVKPQVWRHAMKPETAAALNQMMQAVVTGGTGTAAQISGVKVAGKTGTAETGAEPRLHRLVHLLRARRQPDGCRRRGGRAPAERLRRRCFRPDRQAADAGDPACRVEGLSRLAYDHVRLPDRSHLRQALRDQAQAWLRRDGGRLSRRGPGARPARRAEAAGRPPRLATSSSSSASAARRRAPPASTIRTSSRSSIAAAREGTYYIAMEFLDGPHAEGAARPQRADADPDRDRLRAPDPRRARVRASQRDHPPRHQAAQHRRRRRRPAEGDGLRHRALGRVADDRGRARSSARRSTSRPSRRAARPSTRAPISTRSASSSTRC